MSFHNHSRSNSDSEIMACKDILPIFLEDFLKDFSFNDIYGYYAYLKEIFTTEEMVMIKTPQFSQIWSSQETQTWTSQDIEALQTITMFSILTDKKEKTIQKFLEILSIDYNWLAEKILNAYTNDKSKEILSYLTAVNILRSTFPKHSDFNVRRLKYYCTIRHRLRHLKPQNCLTIYGELGFGKKWLALDACCDFSVMRKMDFKIFWIDVHNCNSRERDLQKLQELKILLGECNFQKKTGDYEGIGNKILELQQELRLIFKQNEFRNSLLVLTDVQNKRTLDTFELRCKRLITTRNKKLSEYLPSSLNKVINIQDGLIKYEYLNMFEKILDKPKKDFPDNASDLFDCSKGHPFLLNMIAQNLKQQRTKIWNPWIRNLEKSKIDDKIAGAIQHSLTVLNDDEMNFFKTLSIFHHSIKIPIKVLAALWKKTDIETKNIVLTFDKFSFVNSVQLECDMACMIHFLYHSYLKTRVEDNQIELHKALVDSYKISNALNNRYEYDLIELPNDNYFHYYIGYHLREAKMFEYFPKLYLDFGFLGQKLRASGLPNTIGDLKYYHDEITAGDEYKEKLVDSLLEFLPNIEEMIFRSTDTYLLQYALMGDGILHEEAFKQVQKFPDKIWFFDGYENPNLLNPINSLKNIKRPNETNSSGHFHRRRQMISLPNRPKRLKLIEPDTCLIALDNHLMLLADLSLGYNIEPTKFEGHNSSIVAIEIFRSNYIISLDREGEVRVWSILDERRRSIERKQSSRSVVNHCDFNIDRMRRKECIQTISKNLDGQKIRVQHFYIDDSVSNEIYLHLAFDNGDICIYKWADHKGFEPERIPTLHSTTKNIQFLVKLLNEYYLLLNNTGSLKLFKLIDSSSSAFSFEWPQDTDAPISVHHLKKEKESVIYVFAMKILQTKFPRQNLGFLKGNLEILYETNERRSAITCSCVSDDNKYLIIGTKQGIIVFDINEKSILLRNSISESIVCVDIFTLDDDIYKYIIISGSEGYRVLNIFGLKINGNESITWANSIGTLGKELTPNPQFEPNAWLMCMFDVNFNKNSSSLVAVDSKNRIHQMTTQDKKWSLVVPNINCKITAISSLEDKYYFGCEDGKIFFNRTNFTNIYDDSDDEIELLQNVLKTKITFLKFFNENLLVASSLSSYKCIVYQNKKIYSFDIGVVNAFIYREQYLILLDEKCSFLVLDIASQCRVIDNNSMIFKLCDNPQGAIFGGAALRNDIFIIGTVKSDIYIYELLYNENDLNNPLKISPLSKYLRNSVVEITCVALASDTNLCAIGLKNGQIEIYKIGKKIELLDELISHKTPIYDLMFSPWEDENLPIILASSSEQLCFWDISYILNNPLESNRQRVSSRFSSSNSHSPNRSITNKRFSFNTNKSIDISLPKNVWSNKKGPSDNPKLLSCIKYAGGKAEKFYANNSFTKFVTIDDEGEYYFLTVQDAKLTNGNGNINGTNGNHNGGNIEDDEVII